ncbi:hypothetical protein Csp2054_05900 [Curtobacterium sp. 'Ferrero']|uniref:hypothetical protein n=1 Tax=Curtobacterium sp. 'Ferrero' TaxID=2033654 RepID=UPI000BD6981D|nr:hypothetical protein [Curtobacterium sp. 'Ferrero']PCN48628.1 hypothetical protein Csp2054_05900 [Curtobacterium sp. 'Ferrero']
MIGGPGVPGRVEVTARALTSLARAVAAERLGAPAKRIRVGLGDAGGTMTLDVEGPARAQDDLVTAATRAAGDIRDRVAQLTGRRVGATHIELTGIVREHEGRVR